MSNRKVVTTKLKHNKNLSGILFMVLHAVSMSILYVLIKHLTRETLGVETLHIFQIAFLYKLAILLFVLPWCLQGNYKAILKTRRIGTHVARGTFSFLGTLCFFVGISGLSVVNTAAIIYLEHILIILIGVWYFKEKFYSSKAVMIALNCAGALLIVKPGFVNFNYYYIFLFLAVLFWALNCTVIKMLGSTERTKAQLFYVMLFSSVFSFPMALYEWRPMELWHVKYILGIAFCYLIHTIAFFKAFKYADMSTVMPFDYCRVLFTGILGITILGETPDTYSIIGYGLIIAGGVYSINSEAKRKRISQAKKNELETEYEQL